MNSKKSSLLIGGSGFIGYHISKYLIKKGEKITIVDINSPRIKSSNLRFIRSNLKNINKITTLIRANDDIYHLAAIVGLDNVSKNKPIKIIFENILTSLIVFLICARHNKRLFFASSSEVYDLGNRKVPMKETDILRNFKNIYKDSRLAYAFSKLFSEKMLLSTKKIGIYNNFIIGRFFNPYGEGGHGVVNKIIESVKNKKPITIYGSGAQTRSPVYISDAINCIYLGMKSRLCGEIFNIGNSDSEISVKRLASLIQKELNNFTGFIHIPLRVNDHFEPKRRVPDISKAVRILKYKPEIDINKGIRIMIK